MDETYSTAASSRGDGIRNPNSYATSANIHTHPNVPRTYVNGSQVPNIDKGEFVYAIAGATVYFYEDDKGNVTVGPSGGKGGQDSNPSRSNTEFVGTTTGRASNGFIQVDWVNSWWQDATLQKNSGWNPVAAINSIIGLIKGGTRKNENKTSWVKTDLIEIKKVYTDKLSDDDELDEDIDDAPPPSSGLDATTLGYGAIAAALILGTKKKRR